MQVHTYLFGSVEVSPERIIQFPQGLLGFEDKRQFMLIHETDKGEPTSYTLQSLEDPALALQIVDPAGIGFNYELALTDEENALLGTPAAEDVAVMIILYKPEDSSQPGLAAGLRAPLLLNTKARLGLQKVMRKLQPSITLSDLANPV